jgi:hypothetical protein
MKTLNFLLLIVGVLLHISCEKTNNNKVSIEYLTTVLGGCNNTRNYSEENDTVYMSFIDNNIHVFTGINYTCGAPFETQCELKDNTVFMSIIDACEDIFECYERCICYYTFEFVFKQGELNQEYKIMLIDPRKETPEIVWTGNFKEQLLTK